ncbi:MAG: VOC family protein [Deltaproteobacteria bacterium]|nr:VOC family protein [Deltaproteobacteria bacterium]MBN2670290.1 VOC family protein [Deltaproteobacteria bacterium]
MYLSLAHICIQTDDLEKTTHFYCDILGMTRVFDFKKNGEVIGFYLRMTEGNFIEVYLEKDAPCGTGGAYRHISFESRDIDGCYSALKREGVEISGIQIGPDHTYSFQCKDPNGVEIEILQYTGASCQLTGTDCELS